MKFAVQRLDLKYIIKNINELVTKNENQLSNYEIKLPFGRWHCRSSSSSIFLSTYSIFVTLDSSSRQKILRRLLAQPETSSRSKNRILPIVQPTGLAALFWWQSRLWKFQASKLEWKLQSSESANSSILNCFNVVLQRIYVKKL